MPKAKKPAPKAKKKLVVRRATHHKIVVAHEETAEPLIEVHVLDPEVAKRIDEPTTWESFKAWVSENFG